MITKRITTPRRLVSQFDPAFVLEFDQDQRAEYLRTLDIEKLGSFKELKSKPTVFKIIPLMSKYEYLINGRETDMWGIFSTHVKGIEYCPDLDDRIELEGDIVMDKYRDLIPRRTYEEIASYIVAIADQASDSVFFSQSVESLRYAQAVLVRDAQKKALESVPMVDATNKSSD